MSASTPIIHTASSVENDAPASDLLSGRTPLRGVRVLIASAAESLRFRSTHDLAVIDARGQVVTRIPKDTEVQLFPAVNGNIRLGETVLTVGPVRIQPSAGGETGLAIGSNVDASAERRYSGVFIVSSANSALLDVVNEVDVEDYVAGVVAGEIWPTFDAEVFRLQAIVARTFVLYQMLQSQSSPWDVTATQSSQVYRGIRDDATGKRAVEAIEATRGIVAAWFDGTRDRLFCTYYSAACGGRSQSAAIFGVDGDILPLSGNVACDYCKSAPPQNYRWGPVRIPKRDVLARLGARQGEWLSVSDIQSIEPVERTPDGRILQLRVIAPGGIPRDFLAERFRMNVGPSVMRSTHCDIRVSGDEVIFENGRGFGHGLGLCQWGAQGQSQEGRRAAEILRFYYPGAKLVRAY